MSRELDFIIGVDPDVKKNGVSKLYLKNRTIEVFSLAFPDLLDFLRCQQRAADTQQNGLVVVIEAGWLIKANWHTFHKDSPAVAAAKGNSVGRVHEIGRKIAECCKYWQIAYELIRPLPLRVHGHKMWRGRDGKITHEEIQALTAIQARRTNQEERDAALIAWVRAGFPVKSTVQ